MKRINIANIVSPIYRENTIVLLYTFGYKKELCDYVVNND